MALSRRTGTDTQRSDGLELDDLLRLAVEARKSVALQRSELLNGLTRRQRTFILEKLTGLNDKEAALVAGYSLSVAENTKQRVWKPKVRAEYERLERQLFGKLAGECKLVESGGRDS
jgi:DNA-directed RNA polymerase specialized sigma24 family protein